MPAGVCLTAKMKSNVLREMTVLPFHSPWWASICEKAIMSRGVEKSPPLAEGKTGFALGKTSCCTQWSAAGRRGLSSDV